MNGWTIINHSVSYELTNVTDALSYKISLYSLLTLLP